MFIKGRIKVDGGMARQEASMRDQISRRNNLLAANPGKKFTIQLSIEDYNNIPIIQKQNKNRIIAMDNERRRKMKLN